MEEALTTAQATREEAVKAELDARINKVFGKFDPPANMIGTPYIYYILHIIEPDSKMEDLYAIVAEENGVKPSYVKYNIRSAIGRIWDDHTAEELAQLYPFPIKQGKDRLTNAEFLKNLESLLR